MGTSARWEWRTFGAGADAGAAAIERLTPTGESDSDEVYFLAPGGTTVKIRDGLIDVKELLEVNPDGLQQWRPVLKQGFPLPAATIREVWAALRTPTPALARDEYTREQLIDELTGPGTGVRSVGVHKHRVRYVVNGCTAELSDVTADGRTTRTIAVEAEDAAAVIEGVRQLGLGDYVNTAYPRGLTLLLDGTPDRFAVIDCGTNSVKFHVAERTADGTFVTVRDRADVTRLGEGLDQTGVIGEEALGRTRAAIESMVEEAVADGAVAIAAVGTAGLRIARNGPAVVDAIRQATHVTIDIIPGDEEARLAYVAVVAALGLGDASLAVFDTGGGSTQVTFGDGPEIVDRFSVDVGAVRFAEQFGLDGVVDAARVDEAIAAIGADLARLGGHDPIDALVGMGGAVTNLAAVDMELDPYDPDRIQGSVLTRAAIAREIERFRGLDADARRSIVGLQPKRAEVILAGACVVVTVMDALGVDRLTVSDRGLRHGVLAARFGRMPQPKEVPA
jgi:exopolyphosphatase/guanosine-5'-triphosphate,3'-diphosphate pyrophosphatase